MHWGIIDAWCWERDVATDRFDVSTPPRPSIELLQQALKIYKTLTVLEPMLSSKASSSQYKQMAFFRLAIYALKIVTVRIL